MSIKPIDDQGAINLIAAIVDRTAKDFMATTPNSASRAEIEKEILSNHFERLTGLDGGKLINHLQKRYDKKRKKSRKGKRHENNQD